MRRAADAGERGVGVTERVPTPFYFKPDNHEQGTDNDHTHPHNHLRPRILPADLGRFGLPSRASQLMTWLLVLILTFPNGREWVAHKQVDTEAQCIETAEEAVAAALADKLDIKWKCQELGEENANDVALRAADHMDGN